MSSRLELIHDWIQTGLGYGVYTLTPASEDASFRKYYRIGFGKDTKIIMDAPPASEDIRAYLDVTARLQACGVHVPEIHALDADNGLLLLDDFGTTLYLDIISADNAEELYQDAIRTLVKIQTGAMTEGLPRFEGQFLLAEMELFRDWLVYRHLNISLNQERSRMLDEVFAFLVAAALEQPFTFVHRDYHSRNLMYTRLRNPGVLDFQDAVFGPVSYDLVSLLRDCYIKWPRTRVLQWVCEYFRTMSPACSEEEFIRWFDLMGVQRHLKASGIFARLCHRDNKAGYLQDIPRTLSYILDLENVYRELDGLTSFLRGVVLPVLAGEKVR
jgi:hypothetical protein